VGIYPQTHRLADQTQRYSDTGEPIKSGDLIRYEQAPGGILAPAEPREGVAAYFPGAMTPGTLYGKRVTDKGEVRYFHITSGTITKRGEDS
jgi:hypothetical protein